jgi:signal transduction histidine kinase
MQHSTARQFHELPGGVVFIVGDESSVNYGMTVALQGRNINAVSIDCLSLKNELSVYPDAVVLLDICACPSPIDKVQELRKMHSEAFLIALCERGAGSYVCSELLSAGFDDVFFHGDDLCLLQCRLEQLLVKHQHTRHCRTMEDRCRDVEKQLEEYIYVVSHDLKAPLRGIASLTDFIRDELGECLRPEIEKLLAMMQSRTDRLQQMIEGILHYSRTAGREHPAEKIILKELINNEIDNVSQQASIQVEVDGTLPIITGDAVKLREVFHNIIENGIRHNDKDQKHIRISCLDLGESLEFSIADNGKGIRAEHREKIFGLFQTLQSKDECTGLGLGLSIVKRIVEQQHGTVRVESTPGHGSTFAFTWRKV